MSAPVSQAVDWHTAPPWAMWWTQDAYGRCWWASEPGWLPKLDQYAYPVRAHDPRHETYDRTPGPRRIERRPPP